MRLTISRALRGQLIAQAAATPDVEVCGIILGTGDVVTGLIPCANISSTPAIAFEIDPATLIAAHRAARDGGASVIGYYHSHPNGVAEPSARDIADAVPGAVTVIVAGGAVAAWTFDSGARRLALNANEIEN